MTTASAIATLSEHAAAAAAERPSDAIAAPRYDRETKLLATITGIGALVALVFFLGLIVIFGSNGRTQRAYSAEHPVPPVTRLAK